MADHLINSESIHIAGTFADITALKAFNTTGLPQNIWAYVEQSGTGEYFLDLTATDAESLPDIVTPTTGSGRWFKKDGTIVSSYNLLKKFSAIEFNPSAFLLFNSGFGIDSTTSGAKVINIGTTNADTINIGHTTSVVNITGTLAYNDVTNLAVSDKLITLNDGGAASSGMGTGFEIEEGGTATGSFKVDGSRNGFQFKAPGAGNSGTLDFSLLTSDRIIQFPDEAGIMATREWITAQAFITGNQTITLTGHITGSGTTSITTVIPAGTIINSMVNDVDWSKLTSKPTTMLGFGITDGVTLNDVQTLTNKTLTSPKINLGSDAQGDLYYRDASGNFVRLPIGTSSQVLIGGSTPSYASVATALGYTPLNINGGNMTGLLVLSGDPVVSLGAATKNYVDNLITGLTWKQSVVATTTTNITLSGAQTIDGVSVVAGDRVLVKDQTTASNNGIYIAASGAWTRAQDNDTGDEIANTTVLIEGGTANGGTQWNCSNSSITLGTTSISFAKIAGAGVYSSGTGLTLTGNVFSIDSTVTTLTGTQTLTNKTLTSPKINSLSDTNGLEILRLNAVASSVNWLDLYNGGTGAHPKIASNGTDANVNLFLESKGSNSYVSINNTTALKVASGTTSERPSTGVNGMVRYNTTTNKLESYENGAWVNVVGTGGGGGGGGTRLYQFSMLGEANSTIGAMTKASDAALGTGNPSGAPSTTNGNPGINNGIVDPYLIPHNATINSLRIVLAGASVSTGTVGTPTVKMRVYRVNYSTRTQLGSDIDITISATGVGVFNNTSGNAFQTAVASSLSIAVNAGDLIGIEFVNQSGTNNGINAISRLFAVLEMTE